MLRIHEGGNEVKKVENHCFRLCIYVVGVAGGRVMGVGGPANIDPGNHWRFLNEFFHRGSQHPREGYRLYMVGVDGRGNINPGSC